MNKSFEDGRWVATFTPSGIGRWVSAGFLCFWLMGWAVGEVFGVMMLVTSLGATVGVQASWLPKFPPGGAGAAIGLFAGVWTTFWTLGGVMAIREVMRLLWGAERIEYDGAGVRRVSRIGPFVSARVFPREALRGIGLRRSRMVLETVSGVEDLIRGGTHQEHVELKSDLERVLALDPPATQDLPKGWESGVDLEGVPVLSKTPGPRRKGAVLLWLIFAAIVAAAVSVAAAALGGGDALGWIPFAILTVFACMAGAGAAWLSLGGEVLRLRAGAPELHRWFATRRWITTFTPPELTLEHQRDSDNDDCYRLVLRGARTKHVIAHSLHEPYELLQVGRWMAKRLGITLRLPSHMKSESHAA